ncbi:hypothetical protein NST33_25345 [Paenibacillus sp. FSL L8-0435]|uniref:hypothetical protein n=1 Tax=Paenibacillus sp. FSL L8-0435 TaxID=2954618 RepID=UPI0030DDB902
MENVHASLGWNSVCNLGSAERGARPEAWNETRNDWNKIGLALAREVLGTTPNKKDNRLFSSTRRFNRLLCSSFSKAGGCPIAQVEDTFTENWGVQSGFA